MDCEEEFMAQPRVNKASNQLKKLLASLQVKMQKADAEWSKGPIVDGDPKYAEALNAAQKAWELYAEKNCLLDSYSSRGGTVQPHQHWECDLKQAEARVLQLEEWDKAF
jgi:uncharacterized protein YecT (DUF1311 family)